MNVAKIKGTHTAMKSALVAAESVYEALDNADSSTTEGECSRGQFKALTWICGSAIANLEDGYTHSLVT